MCEIEEGLIVAELPYSSDKLAEINSEKRKKLIQKAEKILRRNETEKILIANELKDCPFGIADVFFRFAPCVVRLVAERFKVDFPVNLYIKQKTPDKRTEFIIRKMIYDTAGIGIVSDNFAVSREIAERIMAEFGAYTEIYGYETNPSDGITVFPDSGEIMVLGKWKLENFTAEIETYGYGVDSIELYQARNNDFDKIVIKDCQCGKNKLTLERK